MRRGTYSDPEMQKKLWNTQAELNRDLSLVLDAIAKELAEIKDRLRALEQPSTSL